MSWRKEGTSPDYRFSLANERTFLAWIRTAMALIAGAVGIDQLTPNLAPPLLRSGIACFLSLCAAFLAIYAYRRWTTNEKAMRLGGDLAYTRSLKVISIIVAIFAAFLVALVVLV
ncbi:MAG: YidH family protein [Vibrio sp.]